MSYKVTVVGATGNVGREMLNILAERNFPVSEVVALASKDSLGKEVSYGETDVLKVQALEDYDFTGTDIALFSAGSHVAELLAPVAAKQKCVVIDNSSFFRMHPDIPLIVPEVNGEKIADFFKTNIIANPNCSTIQMVVALKPLDDKAQIKRIVVSTYQSVSGAGKKAMDELFAQTKGIFLYQKNEPVNFTKQIAFNLIPQIDVFMDDGSTKEEWKMVNETKKIMRQEIEVNATCVRVPVFVGHSESINVEFVHPLTVNEARSILANAPGVELFDKREDAGYITPIECVQDDAVFVSRLRQDPSLKNALNMWVVSDNLRKGAALNAIQIAEELVEKYL